MKIHPRPLRHHPLLGLVLGGLVLGGLLASCAPVGTDFWWQKPQGPAYQVLVYSFADFDGDGVGDLRGLTEKLDYLESLKVQALWLSPINPAASYHGYDVTDYRDIDPRLGTLEDFHALVKAADERGIRIILDLVFNHTSNKHPWFQDFAANPKGPHGDWYVVRKPATVYGAGGMGSFHRLADGREYFAAFWDGMPDLDSSNPRVVKELKSILDFWLDQGADGFRFDAVKHSFDANEYPKDSGTHQLNKEFWADLVAHVKKRKPDAFTIGEVLSQSNLEVASWSGVFDSLFDFPLADALLDAGPAGAGPKLVNDLATSLKLYGKNGAFYPSYLLSNHDQDRVLSVALGRTGRYSEAAAWNLQLAAMVHTLPGLPWVYYGEELGMEGRRFANDDINRRLPLPWAPARGDGTTFWTQTTSGKVEAGTNRFLDPVSVQEGDPASFLAHYRRFAALRETYPLLGSGTFAPATALGLESPRSIAAWVVNPAGGTDAPSATPSLLVVHHLSDGEGSLTLPPGLRLARLWSVDPAMVPDPTPVVDTLPLGPREGGIWEILAPAP